MRGPIRRFLVVLLVYVALIVAWPLFSTPFLAGFRVSSNLLFAVTGFDRIHVDRGGDRVPEDADLLLSLRLPDTAGGPKQYHSAISGRYYGFVPFAVLLALVVAGTPGWRRRLRVFLIGGLLLNLAVCGRLAVYVTVRWLEVRQQLPADVANAVGRGMPIPFAAELEVLLNRNPLFFILLAVLVWALLTVQRKDLAHWFPSPADRARAGIPTSRRPRFHPWRRT